MFIEEEASKICSKQSCFTSLPTASSSPIIVPSILSPYHWSYWVQEHRWHWYSPAYPPAPTSSSCRRLKTWKHNSIQAQYHITTISAYQALGKPKIFFYPSKTSHTQQSLVDSCNQLTKPWESPTHWVLLKSLLLFRQPVVEKYLEVTLLLSISTSIKYSLKQYFFLLTNVQPYCCLYINFNYTFVATIRFPSNEYSTCGP